MEVESTEKVKLSSLIPVPFAKTWRASFDKDILHIVEKGGRSIPLLLLKFSNFPTPRENKKLDLNSFYFNFLLTVGPLSLSLISMSVGRKKLPTAPEA